MEASRRHAKTIIVIVEIILFVILICFADWLDKHSTINNSTIPEQHVLQTDINNEVTEGFPGPMLTIIDDDGNAKYAKLLLPIVEEKGVSIGTAVVAGRVDTTEYTMTLDELKKAQSSGAEIFSHTWNHLTSTQVKDLDAAAILSDYEKAAEFFSQNGLEVKSIVFPGGSSSNQTCVDVAKQVYSYGFKAGTNKTNYKHSVERWGIDRYSISPGDTLTRENLKNMLDELKQGVQDGWYG